MSCFFQVEHAAPTLSRAAAYQTIRRLVSKNRYGKRKVSDAIAKQFVGGGKGQADLIDLYIANGGDKDS